MIIPGTKKVSPLGEIDIPEGNEIFCFHIEDFHAADYLNTFLESLSNNHLSSFVFSKKALETFQHRYDTGMSTKAPLIRAQEFLQKTRSDRTSDSGDLGEFLLFLFARHVIGAYKLVSKIESRGSTRNTIPGRDGSYIYQDGEGNIFMLLGEAKTMPDSNNGLRQAQGDLKDFWTSEAIAHEVHLASIHMKDEMTEENASLYECYFIDDNAAHAELQYKNIVLIGYSFDAMQQLINGDITESDFYNTIDEDLKRCFGNQKELIEGTLHKSIYCFVPFECINNSRSIFATINNLTV